MSETDTLISTLKVLLKQNGKTYKDVAAILGLSEASIKRQFSVNNFTLKRLEKILDAMGLDISDLFEAQRRAQLKITQLTDQQEREIVSDPLLLIITVMVLNRWTLAEITTHYQISKPECIGYLLVLDRLGLIELQQNNRIKLLVPSDFSWRVNGPIQGFFLKNIATEFLNSNFDEEGSTLICLNGMLASSAKETIERAMSRLVTEFNELSHDASHLPMSEREGTTLVVAKRGWHFSMFEPYRR
ncbi:helix-turn-helix domain-containing protein [Kiloniella sp.]|uniref:helix-turn-helix domain-containing protein n=1 Tax=Kiloniella sp. TaxID=1938587 RepID=UPI003B025408